MKEKIDETAAGASLGDIAADVQVVDDVIQAALAPVFAQRRGLEVAFAYLGALSPRARGNCWALAQAAGHAGWGRMQGLLTRYVWDHVVVRDRLAPLAARFLTCPPDDPVGPGIAVDETAALKKGEHTFAVAPQHAGCTGKMENCVSAVFCAYVVASAGSTWVDFEVHMPERWAEDQVRRAEAGVPEDLAFTTKPDLAVAQIRRLAATGVTIGWVAGDEVYGRSGRLRGVCAEFGLTGVFIVPSDHRIATPAGTVMTVAEAARDVVFERRPCGTGSKGPRYFDWALVATDDPHQVLLVRRLISRPDQLAYFRCHVPDPAQARLPYLATIVGRRWPVEETFTAEAFHLHWSRLRRRHQAIARWHHYYRRLREALDTRMAPPKAVTPRDQPRRHAYQQKVTFHPQKDKQRL